MKYNYSKENLIKACEGASSIAQVCRNLGIKSAGGNYATVKKYLDKYEIDTSHFTGQRWNKGIKYLAKTSIIPLSDILQENTSYSSNLLRKRLIAEGLKEDKCERCGYTENLELHHINGNHYDNRLENLQILCPNCHAKTENFRNRNSQRNEAPENLSRKYSKNHYCICKNCGKEFYSDRINKVRKFCSRECYIEYLCKVHRQEVEPLQDNCLISKELTFENLKECANQCNNITELAGMFNTSRTTIRNYLVKYNLYDEFKYKYDFHAKKVGQYDLDDNLIKEWPSITDAADSVGVCSGEISAVCKHKKRSCGGFIWKYIE